MARRKYVKENNLVKAINTDSLELQKPLVNEYYDINVHNSNMDKIDKGYKQNKNDISNINYELSKTENTKYSTENGVKEFECKNGYVDNIVIEGQTKILNAENIEVEAGTDGAKLVSIGQGDKIEVLTRGVNIFDGLYESGVVNSSGILAPNDLRERTINYILVEPNTKYYTPVTTNVYQYDYNKNFVGHIPLSDGGVFATSDNTKYIKFYVDKGLMGTLQINKGESSLPYQKPQYDKKQISTTLRSLPNGVKDTIEKRGNKYYKIKRCGEVTLNGEENWNPSTAIYSSENISSFHLLNYKIEHQPNTGNSPCCCDKFSYMYNIASNPTVEYIRTGFTSSIDVVIGIQKSKLSAQTVEGFKTWLSQNPTTVVYELATPIITELPNFNPQTFEGDTTLLINSGVIQAEADFEVTNSMGSEIDVLKGKVSNLDDYVVDEEVYYPTLLNGFSQVHFNDNNFIKKIGNMCFMNLVFRNTSSVQDGTLICKLPLNFKSKNVTRVVSIGDILNANIDINENNILIYPSSKNISNVPFRVNCCWEVE